MTLKTVGGTILEMDKGCFCVQIKDLTSLATGTNVVLNTGKITADKGNVASLSGASAIKINKTALYEINAQIWFGNNAQRSWYSIEIKDSSSRRIQGIPVIGPIPSSASPYNSLSASGYIMEIPEGSTISIYIQNGGGSVANGATGNAGAWISLKEL